MVVSSEPHTVPYFGRAVAVRHAYGGKILPACALKAAATRLFICEAPNCKPVPLPIGADL
jgi:hypothetical protein